jgi:asparagine synthase (glutamine-hydrolysing)
MCGICGGIGPKAPGSELLQNQLKSIEHRGPDDSGYYIAPQIALGMCRLAILEISSGRQPASDELSLIKLVFNGEIYNYRELREDLRKLGVRCESSSESEVIIKSYLTHGIEFVSKLVGMFAIALYDSRNNSLFLVRDRMGKKPLWISEMNDGTLFFASEVKALMLARQDRTLRRETISEIMQYGYVNAPNSSFNEINCLPPGTYLTWESGKSQITKYWTPQFHPKTEIPYMKALEKTKEIIESSVKRRLISERPLGSFLSGGYDSTIVTAYMAKIMGEKVQTYSIGFNNKLYNEADYARAVAKHLRTNHHEEIINPDPKFIVEKISSVLDQPFADPSIIPTYLLAKFARENLVVALGGDGGDEIFGGYDRYFAAPVLQKLNPVLGISRLGLDLISIGSLKQDRKLKRLRGQLHSKNSLGERYLSVQSFIGEPKLSKLLTPDFQTDTISTAFLNNFSEGKNLSKLDQLVRSDIHFYLPGDILVKMDLASMANSLEVRSPFLDVNVVEWGLSLPDRYRIKGSETKHILKDVARSLVPAELIDRPKMGFGVPTSDWLRTGLKEMVYDTLTDNACTQRGWFEQAEVKKLIRLHMDGEDKDRQLWPMLMLELWARSWLDPR